MDIQYGWVQRVGVEMEGAFRQCLTFPSIDSCGANVPEEASGNSILGANDCGGTYQRGSEAPRW